MTTKAAGKAKRAGLQALHINLPAALIEAYDREVARLAGTDVWPKPKRTDLMRNALAAAAKTWGA